jgi:membrane-associated protease RseP (regulator of RpoE activity)
MRRLRGQVTGLAALLALLGPLAGGAAAQQANAPLGDQTTNATNVIQDVDGANGNSFYYVHKNQAADWAAKSGNWLAYFTVPNDEVLGVTLQPVSDVLRAQLDLPPDRGVLVASLAGDGPAAQAGLKANDILLELADHPLNNADSLTTQLKAAGEKPVTLEVLREGKPLSLRVRPVYRVLLGPVSEPKTSYYLGIGVTAPEEALRAQLKLPADRGLLATEIVPDSPAAHSGVRLHDLLLELGGTPLDSTETLIKQVQATGGKAIALKFLRGGKPLSVELTPAVRKVEAEQQARDTVRLWTLAKQAHPDMLTKSGAKYLLDSVHPNAELGQTFNFTHSQNALLGLASQNLGAAEADSRIDALNREVKALQKAVEELTALLKETRVKGKD